MNKIDVKQPSRSQLEELVLELMAMPPTPVGDHLNSDDRIAYSMDWLSDEEKRALDPHIESCIICAEKILFMMEPSEEYWSSEEAKSKIDTLKADLARQLSEQVDLAPEFSMAAKLVKGTNRLADILTAAIRYLNPTTADVECVSYKSGFNKQETVDDGLKYSVKVNEASNLEIGVACDVDLVGRQLQIIWDADHSFTIELKRFFNSATGWIEIPMQIVKQLPNTAPRIRWTKPLATDEI